MSGVHWDRHPNLVSSSDIYSKPQITELGASLSHLREKTLPQYFKSKLGHTSMNDKCAKKKLYTMCVFQKKNSEDTKAENDSVTAAIGYSCSRGDSDTSVHTIIKKKKKEKTYGDL